MQLFKRLIPIHVLFSSVFHCWGQGLNLIGDLIKSGKYDKHVRPYHRGDKSVNVTTQLYIILLGPIDEQTYTFEIGYYHRQWWNDPRLSFNSTKRTDINLNISPENFIWVPDATLVNGKSLEKYPSAVRAIISSNGDIYLSQRMKATFICLMNLTYYPMDTQHCPFYLESYAHHTGHIRLLWHSKRPVDYADEQRGMQLGGYVLKTVTSQRVVLRYLVGNATEFYDNLKIEFVVKRTFLYYFYRAYMPTMLLMIFNMGSYWVPERSVPARITLVITTFLASMFILQSATEQTVKVSYTTPMQLFLVVNVVFIVAAIMEYLFVLYLRSKEDDDEHAKRLHEALVKINKTATGIHGIVTISNPAEGVPKNADNPLHEINEKSKPTVHMVDQVFRVGMPMLYVAFCSIYFAYYIGVQR